MQINWEISNKCNYNCSYCYNKDKKDDFPLSEEIIDIILDNIFSLDNTFSITLTGGEPTQSSHLKKIINKIFLYKEKKIRLQEVNFITNGSQDFEYFKDFRDLPKNIFFIRLSIHPKYYTPRLKNLILELVENRIPLKISILYDIKYLDRVVEIVNWIDKFQRNDFFEPSLRAIFGADCGVSYSESDKEYLDTINKKWNYLTPFKNNKFYGQICSFGKILVINSDLTFSSAYCPQARYCAIPLVYTTPKKIKENIIYSDRCRMSCCQVPTDLILDKKIR